ncbi:MAG TPA: dTDP-glucose 4,6-dehydratase, partial [Gammaproteobacteria bacterium]|nr:dTDP-glucose 4,6-dehydratase [Gammaproteobacteria bacterium]
SYAPKKVLVTGGAGFIGCNYIRKLLETDSSVHIVCLDNLSYAGTTENLPEHERHQFVKGDICDTDLVLKLLRDHQIDTIVHFAAESHVDRSITGPAAFIQSNLLGTFSLLEAARKVWLDEKHWDASSCRFHHISTDEVYGTLNADAPPFLETTSYAPNSPYSASKAGSDHLVRSYLHTYGLPVTTTNCSNNYGPYQHAEKFIPTVIRSCLNHDAIPVYGDGTNIRDWLYVDDHCTAIEKVIRQGVIGETYNVGGHNEWANNDIAKIICELLDRKVPWKTSYASLITYVTDRPGHDWRYAIDGTKLKTELNWLPSLQFEEGIEKTIDWYLVKDNIN